MTEAEGTAPEVKVPDDATPENMADQYWRLNNLYWITDKEGKSVLFRMNWAQQELYAGLHYLNLVLKARQLGMTTFINLMILDNCIFFSDTRAGIICHNREDAKVIFRDKCAYPYSKLPAALKQELSPKSDTANELLFANNSSIRVGTSMRSGTLNYLLVSEYAKMCAKFPDKAQEIKTGALNTVQSGQFIIIESTAEGRNGHYHELCSEAMKLDHENPDRRLTPLDWKFFFFPWFKHPDYELSEADTKLVPVIREVREYFEELEVKTRYQFRPGQIAWYVKKAHQQGDDMLKEFPSTPDEAFAASIKGAYYAQQMTQMRKDKRIRDVPYDPAIPICTAWDLGYSDLTAIIFFTHVSPTEIHIIDYYEASGEPLAHYVKMLQDKPYVYDKHYLPHDVEVHSLDTGRTRREALMRLGLRPITVVPRIAKEMDGIQAVRETLPRVWIDQTNCDRLISCLDSYQKEWCEHLGDYKSSALHNWASHGAKAFEQLAVGYRKRSKGGGRRKPRSWRTV